MARLFDQFQAPRTQRRPIDPFALGQVMAAPEVAKEEARARLFQELGQLPQNLFNTYSQFQELKRKGEQAGLEGEKTQSEVALNKVKTKILEQDDYVPLLDGTTGQPVLDKNGDPVFVPKKSKFKTPTVTEREEEKDKFFSDKAIELLDQAKEILNKVPSGFAYGGYQSVGAKSGQFGKNEASQYEALKPSIATKIYRGFTGDTKLSDADAAARALPLLPNITDAQRIRDAKFNVLNTILGGGGDTNVQLEALIKMAPPALANKAKAAKGAGIDSETIIKALQEDMGK